MSPFFFLLVRTVCNDTFSVSFFLHFSSFVDIFHIPDFKPLDLSYFLFQHPVHFSEITIQLFSTTNIMINIININILHIINRMIT